MQRHGLANDPAENNEEWRDEERNLQAGADGDANGKIHLVLVGDDARRDMLRCVAHDRQQDQADERLRDVCRLDDRVDAVH